MGKYFGDAVEVSVKVYENKNAEAKPNSQNGRIFQMLGNAAAHITLKQGDSEIVLFERLSGMVGISYHDKDAYDKGEGMMVVSYTNAFRGDNGSFDKVTPGDELASILKAETLKAFNEGFSVSERDEHDAVNAGMDVDAYTKMSQEAMKKAAGMKKKIAETSPEQKESMAQLEKELDEEM